MSKYLIAWLAISFIFKSSQIANAQTANDADAFTKHHWIEGADTLPYRLLLPLDYDATQKYPLVVFLHGAGERGNDNERTLTHCKELFLQNRAQFPCIVLVPQCPAGKKWVDLDWKSTQHQQPAISPAMQSLLHLLQHIEKTYSIATAQQYAMGLSMGGYGTWDLLAREPQRFAAGVPICGGGDTRTAKQFRHTAVWAFHGAKDNVVPVANSRDMIRAIRKSNPAHKNVKYTEYPQEKHGSWIPALREPDLLQWLFAQRKATN